MNRKLSNKDKKDWKNFLSSKDKIYNKDLSLSQKNINKELVKTIDLHGLSLENANNVINDFINKCFHNNINRIIVVTGKGLMIKNIQAADIKDGGSGAFNIYLKKIKE